ncbi:MAG: carboxymuconolactone decarboxylase family protein [Sphaerochaetaceae bacterium]
MESQIELNESRIHLYDELCKLNPTLAGVIEDSLAQIYTTGALDVKIKYLIALAIALTSSCQNCVLAQLTRALDAEATKEEIMEVISVVFAMRGTTGVGESLRVVKYLEELTR